jgi:hypothetical protein
VGGHTGRVHDREPDGHPHDLIPGLCQIALDRGHHGRLRDQFSDVMAGDLLSRSSKLPNPAGHVLYHTPQRARGHHDTQVLRL